MGTSLLKNRGVDRQTKKPTRIMLNKRRRNIKKPVSEVSDVV